MLANSSSGAAATLAYDGSAGSWIVRKIPLRITPHKVVYHQETKTYALAVSTKIPRTDDAATRDAAAAASEGTERKDSRDIERLEAWDCSGSI